MLEEKNSSLKYFIFLKYFKCVFFFFLVVATDMSEMNIPEIVCIIVLVVRKYLL